MTRDAQQALDAQRSTIETLQEFYALVVAIALTGGVEKFVTTVEKTANGYELLSVVAISIALLSTIVPFYHGMNRYLYETYIARATTGRGDHPIPLLFDIFIFVIEGGLLFAMGRVLDTPETFLALWTALLGVDIFWGLVVWCAEGNDKPHWAVNNLFWVVVAWAVWFMTPPVPPAVFGVVSWLNVCLIAVVEVMRSIIDYRINWNFYFPRTDDA